MVNKRSSNYRRSLQTIQSTSGECVKTGETPSFCFEKFISSVFYSNRIENKNILKYKLCKIAYKGIVINNYYQFKKFYDLNSVYAKHGLSKKNSKFFMTQYIILNNIYTMMGM